MTYLADPAVAREDGIWRAWLIVRYDGETLGLHEYFAGELGSETTAPAYPSDGRPSWPGGRRSAVAW